MITNITQYSRLIAITAMLATAAFAQTTAFTYQGSLNDGGAPANGSYDFEFRLFDQASGGSQLGPVVTAYAVSAAEGSFTVVLDFGGEFPGADRWIEIRVREASVPAGSENLGGFTILAPRQRVNSAPYAIRSLSASSADTAATADFATIADSADTASNALSLGGVSAAQYVVTTDPRLSDARIPTPGSAHYVQNQTTQQNSGNFNISGTGKASSFDASEQYNLGGSRLITTPGGTNLVFGIEAGQASSQGNWNTLIGYQAGKSLEGASNNVFVGARAGLNSVGFPNNLGTPGGSNTFVGSGAGELNVDGTQNAYFGTRAGQSSLGRSNAYFGFESGAMSNAVQSSFFGVYAGYRDHGFANSYFGGEAGNNNVNGDYLTLLGTYSQVGLDNLKNATAIGARSQVDASNSLVLGSISGVNGAVANTMVGIGTTAPEKTLHIKGPGSQEILVESSDANGRRWSIQSSGDTGDGSFLITDRTAFSSRLAILGDGKVGFGTTQPQNKVQVNGALQITGGRSTPAGNAVTLSSESTYDALQSWNNRPLAINGSGNNVGIGTTAPSEKFEISVNSSSILFGGAGCPSGTVAIGLNGAFASCTNYTIRGNGTDTFINRPAGGSIFFREGNGSSQLRIKPGGTFEVGVLGAAGSTSLCRNAGSEIATCSSSRRYKSNIENYLSGAEILDRLRPVTFNWKDSGALDVGLVAEEVADIDPLLVTFNTKGQVEGVKYDRIGVVLVNVVREQQQLLKSQSEDLEMQNERIEKLEKQIALMQEAQCAERPDLAFCMR